MNGERLPIALRFALREMRGGIRGFFVFLACIALGVAAIAGVNSVARALTEGITAEGRAILGGDIAFSLVQRQTNEAERAFLDRNGEVGAVATLRAMARRTDGRDQALVELKAVDGLYPQIGRLELDGASDAQALLGNRNGIYGALAVSELLDRLGIRVGDRLLVGGGKLEVRGTIRSEPDRLSDGIGFGPRLMISLPALDATGLVRPGSLITWQYRLTLPPSVNATEVEEAAEVELPEAGWRIRTRDNAAPALQSNIERFAQFLTLVGLTALIAGGVGVANAVMSFVDLKRPAIATLKCLGAPGDLILRVYFFQILILAAFGILLGLLVGAVLPFFAYEALEGLLPVAAARGFYPRELALAAVYGFLVAIGFSLWPLGRAREMPATALFADRAVPARMRPRLAIIAAQALALATLAALAIFLAADRRVAVIFVGGVVAAFAVLRLIGLALQRLAGWAGGGLRGAALRLAVRNIARPGALTGSVVLSLGLGLTLLVTLALIDTNLRRQLDGRMAEAAPDLFFVDVQDSEADAFAALLAREAPEGEVERVPMLRGRITALKGVPTTQITPPAEVRWVLSGDRGLTYADRLPANSTLVGGEWWPEQYGGEPLVSFDAEIAEALGLRIGDEVTVNVLGRNVSARIHNLRRLDWESLSINFVMVYSPNTFAGAPATHLATLRLSEGESADEGAERAVLSAVTASFPSVTSVRVKEAIDAVNAIVSQLALAVRVAASLALLVSMLVLGGALAAGQRQRRQDAVILKALGATRAHLIAAFTLEYGLLGLATAIFAVAAGSAAAWVIVTHIMEFEFAFLPEVAVAAVLAALLVTIGLGLAGTWAILSMKAAPYLRNL